VSRDILNYLPASIKDFLCPKGKWLFILARSDWLIQVLLGTFTDDIFLLRALLRVD